MKVGLLAVAALLGVVAPPVIAAERFEITAALIEAAEREGQLVLQYSNPLTSMQGYAMEFNKAYPKIRINLERKAGSAGAYALLQETQAGISRVDLFQGSDLSANQELVDKNAFAALEPANIGEFPKIALPMAPYIYYADVNRYVISYNPKLVTDAEAEELRPWTGVLAPKFKGRISLVEPTFGVTLAPLTYVMKTPGLGEDFLRQLKAQAPQIYLNTAQAREAVVSGQRAISWGAQWEAVILSDIQKGIPVRFIYPEPEVAWAATGWGVLKNAPHPSAARLFMAWLLSPDGARAMMAPHSNSVPTLRGIEDTRAPMTAVSREPWFKRSSSEWVVPPEDMIKEGPKFQEIWMKIMKGRS
jgi:iron(III) transport system substrate-binding protein